MGLRWPRLALSGLALGAAVLLWPVQTAAAPASSRAAPRLVLEVKPAKLVLGKGRSATVTARLVGGSRGATAINVTVTVGALHRVSRVGGVYRALYAPPKRRYPQLALFTAVATHRGTTAFATRTLPLWGLAKVEVRTRPGAPVTVTVGGARFGPVRADRQGRARVGAVIPPGTDRVSAANRTVRVAYPPSNRLSIIAGRAQLPAGSKKAIPIYAYVVTAKGAPARRARLQGKAQRGVLSAFVVVGPGRYRAQYHAPRTIGNGRDAISVQLHREPTSAGRLAFTIHGGPLWTLKLRPDRPAWRAGSRRPVALEIHATDRQGQPTRGAIRCTSTVGTVTAPRPRSAGRYTAQLRLPHHFRGRREARVRCVVQDDPRRSVEARVRLRPASPARIRLQKLPGKPRAKFRKTVRLRAVVLDAYDNVVPGAPVRVNVTTGQVARRTRADGSIDLRYESPALRLDSRAQLSVSTSGLVASKTTVQVPRSPYWLSLGAQAGLITNFGNLTSPLFNVGLQVGLDRLLPGLWVAAEAGYYFRRSTASAPSATAWLHGGPLLASLGYRFWVHRRVSLQGGLGVGVTVLTFRTRVAGADDVVRHSAPWLLQAALGVALRLGPGDLIADLRYQLVGPPRLDGLEGRPGGLALILGYRLGLF